MYAVHLKITHEGLVAQQQLSTAHKQFVVTSHIHTL